MSKLHPQDLKDKFIAEAMGLCYHEWITPPTNSLAPYRCTKCGLKVPDIRVVNTDFSTWDGLGKLWNFVEQSKWKRIFLSWFTTNFQEDITYLINPEHLQDAVILFLTEEKENSRGFIGG